MEQIDIKKAQDDFFKLLETDDELTPTVELFQILENYAKARAKAFVGLDLPIHFYFKRDFKVSRDNGYFYAYERYNPITNEVCNVRWNGMTRAFSTPNGDVYIDFNTMNNMHQEKIDGYFKADHLIDFAFTLEHELRHVKQFVERYKSEKYDTPTLDSLRTAKDMLTIQYVGNSKDELTSYFYINGHNRFYIEMDANKHADDFMSMQFILRHLAMRQIDTPGISKTYILRDILNKRISDAHLSMDRDTKMHLKMMFGLKESTEVTLETDPEKIIDLLVDELIRGDPKTYLTQYPMLKYIYNDDGSKKTFQEIKTIVSQSPDKEGFYSDVVSRDALLSIQKIEDDMTISYNMAQKEADKQQVLQEGLDKIRELISKETIDLDNIILYLDKRSHELDNIDTDDKQKNTSKLIYLVIKRAVLEKEEISKAYYSVANSKEDVIRAQQLLEAKETFDFKEQTPEEIRQYLRIVKARLNMERAFHYYKDKGFTPEEIDELEHAVNMVSRFYTSRGYKITGSRPAKNPQLVSVLKGLNSLYDTKFYHERIENNPDLEEASRLRDDFELANQIYIECQKHIGLAGIDFENSFIAILGNSPLITTVLTDSPEILDMLTEIKDMEDKEKYTTRLEASIFVCKTNLRNLAKKGNSK